MTEPATAPPVPSDPDDAVGPASDPDDAVGPASDPEQLDPAASASAQDELPAPPVPAAPPVPSIPPLPSDPPVPTGTGPATDLRLALVVSVNVDLPNQHPTVILRESESPRRQLSFSIGLQDAVVLAHAMRRIPTPRPLTHELLSQVLQGFDIDVVAVRLVGRQGSVYFAELDLRGRTGRTVYSCRPSDALTLALLQPVSVPILIDGRLFDGSGDVVPPGSA